MSGPAKVIVVDADPAATAALRFGLARAGISAKAVSVPGELVAAARGAALVVIGQGASAVRAARDQLEAASLPLPILFVGPEPEGKRRELERAGATEVVLGPVFLRDVASVARVMLGERRPEGWGGNLAEQVGVLGLVRGLAALGRSGVLTLTRGIRRGEIRYYHGEITSAQVGIIHGQAAFHQLLLWTEARFDFRDELVVRRQQIPLPPEEVMADAERFLDSIRDVAGGLSPAVVLDVMPAQMAALASEIPSEVHGILNMFDGQRALVDVLEDSLYRVYETLRIVRKGFESKVLRVVPQTRNRKSWRPPLPLEAWLIGSDAPTPGLLAGDSPAPGRNRRDPGPLDWAELVPRISNLDMPTLSPIVPATKVAGEISVAQATRGQTASTGRTVIVSEDAIMTPEDRAEEERLLREREGREDVAALEGEGAEVAQAQAAAQAEAKAAAEAAAQAAEAKAAAEAAAQAAEAKAAAEAAAQAEAKAAAEAAAQAAEAKAAAEAAAQAAEAKAAAEAAAQAAEAKAAAEAAAQAEAKAAAEAAAQAAEAKAAAEAAAQAAEAKAAAEAAAQAAEAAAQAAEAKAAAEAAAQAAEAKAAAEAAAQAEAKAAAEAAAQAAEAKAAAEAAAQAAEAKAAAEAAAQAEAKAAEAIVATPAVIEAAPDEATTKTPTMEPAVVEAAPDEATVKTPTEPTVVEAAPDEATVKTPAAAGALSDDLEARLVAERLAAAQAIAAAETLPVLRPGAPRRQTTSDILPKHKKRKRNKARPVEPLQEEAPAALAADLAAAHAAASTLAAAQAVAAASPDSSSAAPELASAGAQVAEDAQKASAAFTAEEEAFFQAGQHHHAVETFADLELGHRRPTFWQRLLGKHRPSE